MVHPCTIFTIHHPSYPSIWAYITHMTLHPRFPLFLVYVEKIGEPGDEARLTFPDSLMMWTISGLPNFLEYSFCSLRVNSLRVVNFGSLQMNCFSLSSPNGYREKRQNSSAYRDSSAYCDNSALLAVDKYTYCILPHRILIYWCLQRQVTANISLAHITLTIVSRIILLCNRIRHPVHAYQRNQYSDLNTS